ncbi:MAG: (2Fe-2S)-binding protein, partial [Thermomicrobiales bacterium]
MFVPTRSETLETSIPNLYLAGDAAGIRSVARAFAEGRVAGAAASGGAGLGSAVERMRALNEVPAPAPRLPAIANDTLVCRCEVIAAGVVRSAIEDGTASLSDLKRRTRAGMGVCQGVFCARTMAELIAAESGAALEAIAPMTARPPARLIPMAALADFEV